MQSTDFSEKIFKFKLQKSIQPSRNHVLQSPSFSKGVDQCSFFKLLFGNDVLAATYLTI